MKHQAQNTKLQRSSRQQAANSESPCLPRAAILELEFWSFSGVWSLAFGAFVLGIATLLYLCSDSAQAMSPHLTATTPVGAQRGTDVEVILSGERLADAQELLWYSPGIQVSKLEVPTNQASLVKAQLKIAPDCPLGEHALRLRCASGVSD